MRIAPHIIKPYTPTGCKDWLLKALKVALLAIAFLSIGYAMGIKAKYPERTEWLLQSIKMVCGLRTLIFAILVSWTIVGLKLAAGSRQDDDL